jgi:signal transduction histidine kinase/integral membrane sensor domain MASE1
MFARKDFTGPRPVWFAKHQVRRRSVSGEGEGENSAFEERVAGPYMKTALTALARQIMLAALYFAAGKLGLMMAAPGSLASPFWPPAGLALAAVLLLGRGVWPAVLLGAFLVNFTSKVLPSADSATALLASLGISLGNTLEALVGAELVNRFAQGKAAFQQPRTVLVFAAVAGLASTSLAASAGLVVYELGHMLPRGSAGDFWVTWWLGDMVGVLVLTPLLVVWSSRQVPRWNRNRALEAAAVLLLLGLACGLIFAGVPVLRLERPPLGLLVIPAVLWSALRFGLRGTTLVVLLVAVGTIAATVEAHGPFAVGQPSTSERLLQNFVGLLSVMSLLLAADVLQRQRMQTALQASGQKYRQLFERAAAFSELGNRLSACRTAKDAARIIVETADALLDWDACCFDLCSPDQNTTKTILCLDTVAGKRQDVSAECTHNRPTAHTKQVWEKGACLVLRPVGAPFPPDVVPFGDKQRPSASLMFVPVRSEARTIGVLTLQSYRPKAYTDEDLKLLQALADHCGGALERLRAEQEVQRLNRELRHHLEEMQTVFNTAPVGIALAHDPECRNITGNPTCAAMLGLPATNGPQDGAARDGQPVKLLRAGKEVSASDLPMQSAAREAKAVTGQELDIVFSSGRVIHSYVSASPLYDDAGKVRGSLGIFVDMTAQRHAQQEILRLNAELERRVRERTAQLEAVNKELEAFSYSVSHDLRAPLRGVRGFSEVVLQRYGAKLDPRGQEFLRRACESAQQMDRLIEDLLKLSRVGRSELQHRTVNLSALAQEIVLDLRQAEPQRALEVVIASDLQATGDERLLRIALENLLRNAWKFTGKAAKPRVEFGVLTSPPRTFFVRDNGAGFDMKYLQRLFGVFQRLHSSGDFPGTGIGLATVQRIINRHGGRVWAEGRPGEGATFYFRLPGEQLFE